MQLKEIKKEIRKNISMFVGKQDALTEEFIRQKAVLVINNLNEAGKATLSESEKETIIKSLCDDFLGFGPLNSLMQDDSITEIMVNGPYKVYIEKRGKKKLTDIVFDDEAHLRYIIEKMLRPTGRRVDESFPYVDFALSDGSRVNVIIPPLSVGGAVITIRKFLKFIENLQDLVKMGTLNDKMKEFLIACVKAKLNILLSGATGSGKTTTLEVLSSYIDPEERIITIEDALEMKLRQEHVVRLLTKPSNIEGKGEITLRELFRNTLRMRPNRIVLGEIRGEEALDYLQALNSGHKGCLAVIHASSPLDALLRLETLALYGDVNLPVSAIREQIANGLDLVVQQEQLVDGSRKIVAISEILNEQEGGFKINDIFVYKIERQGDDNKIKGGFEFVNKPHILPLFERRGVEIDERIFS